MSKERDELKARLKQNELDVIKLCEEGSRISSEIKALDEPTYSIGDRFRYKDTKSMLVAAGNGQVAMINLRDGGGHCGPKKVGNFCRITKVEFENICKCGLTRYWDNRKQVLV